MKMDGHQNKKSKQREQIRKKQKAENTNKSTKLWINCLEEYLEEKSYPKVDDFSLEELPGVIEKFYLEIRKKNDNVDQNDTSEGTQKYPNTTLKTMRGALACYFKQTRSIDIMLNELSSHQMQLLMLSKILEKKKVSVSLKANLQLMTLI